MECGGGADTRTSLKVATFQSLISLPMSLLWGWARLRHVINWRNQIVFNVVRMRDLRTRRRSFLSYTKSGFWNNFNSILPNRRQYGNLWGTKWPAIRIETAFRAVICFGRITSQFVPQWFRRSINKLRASIRHSSRIEWRENIFYFSLVFAFVLYLRSFLLYPVPCTVLFFPITLYSSRWWRMAGWRGKEWNEFNCYNWTNRAVAVGEWMGSVTVTVWQASSRAPASSCGARVRSRDADTKS